MGCCFDMGLGFPKLVQLGEGLMVEEMVEELEHLRRRSHWMWISDYHMDVVRVIVRTDQGRRLTNCMEQLERPQRQHRSQLVRR
jgi:hypothetical protein